MITQRIHKPKPIQMLLLAIISFFIGNRLASLYLLVEDTPLVSIAKALDAFLPSLSFSQMGWKLDLTSIPLCAGFILLLFIECIYLYFSTQRKNFKVGEEHGSARYGTPKEAKEIRDSTLTNNMILSQNVLLSPDTRKTFLNDNILCFGGSGSGKTRFFVKPNALQLLGNYIFTDPKGTLIKEIGSLFQEQEYEIKILDIKNFQGMGYNPFHYCETPEDVTKVLNNIMENSGDPNRKGNDEFWDKAGLALLMSLSFLVMGTDLPENQHLPRVLELIDLIDASEEDENAKNVIDYVFEDLQKEIDAKLRSGNRELVMACKNSYEYLACRQYTLYKKASGKTAKSILITLGAKLSIFNLPAVDEFLRKDEVHLETIGSPKIKTGKENLSDKDADKYVRSALFICISDSDSTYNFLAAVIYQQLFDLLYKQADMQASGKLPVHVYAILDEFANTGKIPDFDKKIATMRSRELSVMIILQNLSQLKSMYKDDVWETIYGNCDTTIFLGGKEFSTLEYLSKTIGNTTIDYMSVSETKGSNGSWSRSNQLIQRALLPPDEIKRMKKDECLVDIRSHFIYRDKKYNLLKHPNYPKTGDAEQTLLFNWKQYIQKQRRDGAFADKDNWIININNQLEDIDEMDIIDFDSNVMDAYVNA